MAFLLTVAVLAQRAVEQERAHRLMLLIGLLAGAAVLLRTIGFTLILAVAAACLYRKRHGSAIAFLSTCIPVVIAGTILQGNNDSLQAWVEQGWLCSTPHPKQRTTTTMIHDSFIYFLSAGANLLFDTNSVYEQGLSFLCEEESIC